MAIPPTESFEFDKLLLTKVLCIPSSASSGVCIAALTCCGATAGESVVHPVVRVR